MQTHNTPAEKLCKPCGRILPQAQFYVDRSRPDGLSYRCRECRQAHAAVNGYDKANRRKWFEANREKHRKSGDDWRKRNRDKANESHRRQHAAKPEHYKAYRKMANHIYQARKRSNGGSYTIEEWTSLCESVKNLCVRCGEKKELHVDHVLPISKGGCNSIWNIQPLCKSCNSWKNDRYVDFLGKKRAPAFQPRQYSFEFEANCD